MATSDLLLELMYDWIRQRKECAEELIKLAKELESLREKCNGAECVGNTVSVVGATCLLGAGVATLFTGGAAAPFLGVLGAAYTGVGVAVTLTSKLIELFNTSEPIEKAKKIEEKSKDIEDRIKKMFKQLKAEAKKLSSVRDDDDEDRYVMIQFLEAVAKKNGMKQQDIRYIVFRIQHDDSYWCEGPDYFMGRRRLHPLVIPTLATGLGVLAFFTFKLSGKKSKALLTVGTEQIVKKVSTAGLRTVLKGGAMVVGGIVGLAFALPEAIDSWTEQVKKKHETEASQSLRDTAKTISNTSRTLKKQLDSMKKMLEDMVKKQEEEDERIRKIIAKKTRKFEKYVMNQSTKSHSAEASGGGGGVYGGAGESGYFELGGQGEGWSERDGTGGSAQGGEGDGGDGGRDGEDGASSEESDSESSEESDDDDRSQQRRKKKKRRLKKWRKHHPNWRPANAVRVASVNARSMRNKPSKFHRLITENEVDVAAIQETWLEDDASSVLDEAMPDDFVADHEERGERGGGVANIMRWSLHESRDYFGDVTTFEYVATVLENGIIFINVYRPPGQTEDVIWDFLEELQKFLDEVFKTYESVVIVGDFNIWIDTVKKTSFRFVGFWMDNGLEQHIWQPTYNNTRANRSGTVNHTLDLLFTRNVGTANIRVQWDDIADHYTIYADVWPESEEDDFDNEEEEDEEEEEEDEDEDVKRYKSFFG